MLDLSLIIPTYNEAESLSELHAQLCHVLPPQGKFNAEILYIDDGSSDDSYSILKQLQKTDVRIRIIRFPKNMGKTIALAQGFKLCQGNIIVTLDADLQNDPGDIIPMIEQLNEKVDLVCGWRKIRKDPWHKTIPSLFINFVIRHLVNLDIHDVNCGLKVFKREIIKKFQLFGKQHRYIPLKAYFSGYYITEHILNHRPRQYGQSKYGFLRFPEGVFDLLSILFIGKFNRSPIYLFGGLGFMIFMVGFLILSYLSVGWLFGQWISSRPLFSMSILLIIFGFQMISIGLLAELMLNLFSPDYEPPYDEIEPGDEAK
ncbi:glycosyltransferase [candidate division CSSED10-310 bacterium]|uniref:Glycosyltransferase n=1 Tax=candidate division CSSED10-310 bacterium TaxID=2855610 RepID=A0ABV6Z3R2_UNCC1